jgi:hypothetical protein
VSHIYCFESRDYLLSELHCGQAFQESRVSSREPLEETVPVVVEPVLLKPGHFSCLHGTCDDWCSAHTGLLEIPSLDLSGLPFL